MPVTCPDICPTCPECIPVTFSNVQEGDCAGNPCTDIGGTYDLIRQYFPGSCIWAYQVGLGIWITCGIDIWILECDLNPPWGGDCVRWTASAEDYPLCPPFGGAPVPWVPDEDVPCTCDVLVGPCVDAGIPMFKVGEGLVNAGLVHGGLA